MEFDITSLLKKDSLTGDEVGRIFLLQELSIVYKNKSLVTDQDIRILCSKLKSQEDSEHFECYKTFIHWLHSNYNAARANSYQAYHLLSEVKNRLQQTIYAEQIIAVKNANTQLDSIIKSLSVFDEYNTNFTLQHYLSTSKDALKICLARVIAFNTAVELFSDFFDIVEIQNFFTVKTEHFEHTLMHLNNDVKKLKSILTGDKDIRKVKKMLTNQIFPKLNIVDLEPTEPCILQAKESLPNLFKQHKINSIIKILKPDNDAI